MARRGDIEIPIGADASGVEKAIRNGIIEPVESADKALKKLGDNDAGRDIDRSMDRAQDATKKLSRELDDTRAELKKLGYAAKDAGDDGARGMDRIRGGANEVANEMGSNLGEAVSSFRGDMGDLGQIGQDTFGGLAATIAGAGPAGFLGALALAAGAVGLGAVTAGMEDAKKKQDELNQRAADFAQIYVNSAGRIADAAAIVAEIQAIATDPDRYAEAQRAHEDWGVSVTTAMRVMAGDATALAIAQDALTQKEREFYDSLSAAEQKAYDLGGAFQTTTPELDRGRVSLDQYSGALDQGRRQAEDAARALAELAASSGTATGATDDLGNAIVRLPGGKEIVVDAKTGRAYEDLDALEKKKLNDKSMTVHATVDDTAVRNYVPPRKQAVVEFKARQTGMPFP